jgi:hypothetical protein
MTEKGKMKKERRKTGISRETQRIKGGRKGGRGKGNTLTFSQFVLFYSSAV